MATYRIEHYLTADGQKDLYIDWLGRLRDGKAMVAIIRRVARIEQGNFGDHKSSVVMASGSCAST